MLHWMVHLVAPGPPTSPTRHICNFFLFVFHKLLLAALLTLTFERILYHFQSIVPRCLQYVPNREKSENVKCILGTHDAIKVTFLFKLKIYVFNLFQFPIPNTDFSAN